MANTNPLCRSRFPAGTAGDAAWLTHLKGLDAAGRVEAYATSIRDVVTSAAKDAATIGELYDRANLKR